MSAAPAPDDPRVIADARRGLIRTAAIYTPLFTGALAITVLNLVRGLDGNSGSWVVFAIAGLLGLLLGSQALQALRDLFDVPTETTGMVIRKWDRREVFFARGHYLRIGRRIFRVPQTVYAECSEVGEGIRLIHYPHTLAVLSWERAPLSPEDEARLARDAEPDFPPPPPESDLPEFAREVVEPPIFGADSDRDDR